MADEPTPDAPKGDQDPPKPPDPPAKPPWGDDDFDPDKAWKLISNLRADVDKTKADRDAFKTKVDEFEAASKSEVEKLQDQLKAALDDGTASKTDLARLRAALKHGLDEEDLDLLGTGTPEEIDARAERIAKRLKGAEDDRRPPAGGNRRERLRGGNDPTEDVEENDPRKLAARIPR